MSTTSADERTLSGTPVSANVSPGGPGGVGLNDLNVSDRRRKLLELMNRLGTTGAQLDLDVPQIAVLGGQSAGKSSLIEAISGITFPRASGTCTRCPTECRMSCSPEPWKCDIYLRYGYDSSGQLLTQPRSEQFGPTITDPEEVEIRLKSAQLAILNPSVSAQQFLNMYDDRVLARPKEVAFTRNFVSIRISGPNVADLSFCDLPGLIATVTQSGNPNDIPMVESLVSSYIDKPSCLILLTVACETDFETQSAYNLASKYDPQGERTIGVLTKPDRIPVGEEDRWIEFIRNQYVPLKHGWYCVKQPDSQQLKEGVTWSQARERENSFFFERKPWAALASDDRQHLGTLNLVSFLSDTLSDLIAQRLPQLQDELQKLLDETEQKIFRLPSPPPKNSLREIRNIINNFSRDIEILAAGDPRRQDGLLQQITGKNEQFRKKIRFLLPRFMRYKDQDVSEVVDITERLFSIFTHTGGKEEMDEEDLSMDTQEKNHISIDAVVTRIRRARTRELPGQVPNIVTEMIIQENVDLWKAPAKLLLKETNKLIGEFCTEIITRHFKKYDHSGFLSTVKFIVHDHIKRAATVAETHIDWLISLEHYPFTLDPLDRKKSKFQHSDCVKRFLGEICGVTDGLIAELEDTENNMFLHKAAIDILTTVAAYLKVSHRRFIDMVGLAIDKDLVRGIAEDIRDVLERSIILDDDNDAANLKRSTAFLQEQPSIHKQRGDLEKKMQRLNAAKQELMQSL